MDQPAGGEQRAATLRRMRGEIVEDALEQQVGEANVLDHGRLPGVRPAARQALNGTYPDGRTVW